MFADSGCGSREFQRGLDRTASRRKRQDERLSLRKQQRKDRLQSLRQEIKSKNEEQSRNATDRSQEELLRQQVRWDDIASYSKLIDSNDMTDKLRGVMSLRLLSATANRPPLHKISTPVIHKLVRLLYEFDHPKLQFESAWLLSNISSGSRDLSRKVIQNGGAKALFTLLRKSNDEDCREQAIWGIGNLFSDDYHIACTFLKNGLLSHLITDILMHKPMGNRDQSGGHINSRTMRLCVNTVWCICNGYQSICKPRVVLDGQNQQLIEDCYGVLLQSLPVLLDYFHICWDKYVAILASAQCEHKDDETSDVIQGYESIFTQILWCISHLSENFEGLGNPLELMDVLKSKHMLACMVKILSHPSHSKSLIGSALRVIGNLLSCTDDRITEAVIDAKFLSYECWHNVLHVQGSKSSCIRRSMCWCLSNIAASMDPKPVNALIQNEPLLQYITQELLPKESNKKICRECLHTLSNLLDYASYTFQSSASSPSTNASTDKDIVETLTKHHNVIAILLQYIASKFHCINSKLLFLVLESLKSFLLKAVSYGYSKREELLDLCEQAGMTDILDDIITQYNDDDFSNNPLVEKILKEAEELLEKLWPQEEVLPTDNKSAQTRQNVNEYMTMPHFDAVDAKDESSENETDKPLNTHTFAFQTLQGSTPKHSANTNGNENQFYQF